MNKLKSYFITNIYQFPEDYHGGVRYVEQAEDDFPYYKIDEHWELMMMPNI